MRRRDEFNPHFRPQESPPAQTHSRPQQPQQRPPPTITQQQQLGQEEEEEKEEGVPPLRRHYGRRPRHDQPPLPPPAAVPPPQPSRAPSFPQELLLPASLLSPQQPQPSSTAPPTQPPVPPHISTTPPLQKPHQPKPTQPQRPHRPKPTPLAPPPQPPAHGSPAEAHHFDPEKIRRSGRTSPFAWVLGILCAILWFLIIVGGLTILIIYLLFRPKSPRFDIPAASLNAAYLDMGVLLNADVTFLANFSNPNHKVKVEYSYIVFGLYYHNNLIASSASYPFSAAKTESRLQSIHMVTSEVRLPDIDVMRLRKQVDQNMVTLEVRGRFRTRSSLGRILRYSYWLHATCMLNMTGSPSGVLLSRKCSTKR
ncbi:hypothetical protein Scep_017979 [Stephania cephalantha]|uniref:Late embryogenesis abundant protein LEA-2 subgroup domain-containing protein n=1 Tax=Stephania cephalantha TaxID=152367 RepID=A0AAP0IQK1_9MAGN